MSRSLRLAFLSLCLVSTLAFITAPARAAEQAVLVVNVNGSYNTNAGYVFQTVQLAGAVATYVNLSANGQAATLIAANHYDQIWIFDLSVYADAYTPDWQAIAAWFNADRSRGIICDARMLSSYYYPRNLTEGRNLSKNYYENLKTTNGGIVLGTDHNQFQGGINAVTGAIGLNLFSGVFTLATIPVDTTNPLMAWPNNLGASLSDDSSPGQAPFGVQPNGRILYSVAWHSGNPNSPGIAATFEGTVGLHVNITSPATDSHFKLNRPVSFACAIQNGTAPVTYQWTSSRDGVIGTASSFQKSNLTVGNHVVAVLARDVASASDTDVTTVVIDDVPDLAVRNAAWSPAGEILENQPLTLSAVVDNVGHVQLAPPFSVDFRIDGISVGAVQVTTALVSGASVPVARTWTALLGTHTLAVVADPAGAVDELLEANNTATAGPFTVVDRTPPEEVTNLQAESRDASVVLRWTPSANSAGDLANYRLYVDGALDPATLGPTASAYEKTGLSPASSYSFRVTAYDVRGNESPGRTVASVTWLQNPAGLAVTPHAGYATLTWEPVQPAPLLEWYRVWVAESTFATVQGMTPRFTITGTTVNVAGLENNSVYYFAVTSVNVAGGERTDVAPLAATPMKDLDGPMLSDFRVDAQPLLPGTTVVRPCAFSVQAADPAGVSRVEFFVDGTPLGAASSTTGRYSVSWVPTPVADGAHTLWAVAFDSFSNVTTETVAFVVALAPPPAPTITYPASALLTERKDLTVSGTAPTDVDVQLSVNGSAASSATAHVDSQGRFSIPLTLVEGQNAVTAAARNRAGFGPPSAPVTITLDSTLPDRPTNLYAESKPAGIVRLSWNRPPDPAIVGYRLYRSTTAFTSSTPSEAVRVNPQPLTTGLHDDLPPQDGLWYYRAVSLDKLNRESLLSELASATSDRLAPHAESITWIAAGPHDPASGRVAPGRVDVVLRVDEPLADRPFLSLNPTGASPLSIPLAQGTTAVEYVGSLQIPPTMPSGQAWAVFSALDVVGNRGTDIASGATLLIDSKGPDVVRLVLDPTEPIKNDQATPVTLRVTIGLDDMQVTTAADLRWAVASAVPASVEGLIRTTPATGETDAFTGLVHLPPTAGLSAVENLEFTWHGQDDLGNVSRQLRCQSSFQIYQGALPPLAVPQGLTATSLPAGRIRLSWKAVPQAAGYRVYRKAASDPTFTELPDLAQVLEFAETPPSEGVWTYAVASIRELDGERSPSARSAEVQVASDATPPQAPENLTLELVPRGIQARWQVPPFTEAISYDLYRTDGQQIMTLEGLSALQSGILLNAALDGEPSATDHCYAVVARDLAGNLSPLSNSAVLVVPVLPVRTLTVRHVDSFPTLSWTHEGTGISGYDLRVNGSRIGTVPFAGTTYVDAGFAQDERTYSVAAVAPDGTPSPARTLTLPLVTFQPEAGQKLRRNVMNRLRYQVQSRASTRFSNVRLTLVLDGHTCTSEPFDLDPDATLTVPIVVAGYQSLPDLVPATATLELSPADGEQIVMVRTTQLEVVNGLLVLTLEPEAFTRGATGRLRFNLENTGDEPVDLVLATKHGAAPSDALTVLLRDEQDNVLSTTRLLQTTADSLIHVPDGRLAARVAPGTTLRSSTFTVPVATSCPDVVTAELVVTPLFWRLGEPEVVSFEGPRTSRRVSLIETPYDCVVTSVTPASSRGDVPVVIAGTALDRASGVALPDLPIRIVVSLAGFDRTFQTFSGPEGTFSYAFQPLLGESGRYQVGATHPARTETPAQGFFTIQRLLVTPVSFDVRTPTNYRAPLQVMVTTGREFTASNLRLTAAVPSGLHFEVGPPVQSLSAGQSALLTSAVWADASSPPTTSFDLEVRSDDDAGLAWASVRVVAQFSAAAPSLRVTPDHVETGAGLGDQVLESLVLENKGLAALRGLALSVLDQNKTTSPTWVQLSTPAAPGDLAVGAKREVSLSFQPPAGLPEGQYTFYLRVQGQNQAPLDIPLFLSVTGSGQGAVLVHVSDIYTGTLDKDTHETIAGLAGATVKVQNELVASVHGTLTTGREGTASFTELPVGRYRYRVSAPGHEDFNGSFWIKPGVTQTAEPFLRSELITVEWSVVETTIRDTYSIALSSTFQTDVPAAVVVAEPASVTLPPMRPGDVYNGSFQLTNHGLIRADNLALALPVDDSSFLYETLSPLPTSLDAKTSISVPYRVICLAPTGPPLNGTGGGDCRPIFKLLCTTYHFHCSNGDEYNQSVYHVTIVNEGDCGGSAAYSGTDFRTFADAVRLALADGDPTGGTTPTESGGGGAGGGVIMRVAFDPSVSTFPGGSWFGTTDAAVAGRKCWPVQETTGEVFALDPRGAAEELLKMGVHAVGCMVNGFTRDVYDDVTDLWIKVPGGTVTVRRRYYGQPVTSADGSGRTREYGWYFAPGPFSTIDVSQANKFMIISSGGGSLGVSGRIVRQGAVYYSPTGDLWRYRASSISRLDSSTYQWIDKDCNWERYDLRGVLLSWGSRFGVIGNVVLDPATGRTAGVRDRNGRQVLWLDYANGRLVAARDYTGRRVDYQSVAGGAAGDRLLLTHVTAHPDAATEQVTTYEYQQTRVVRSVDSGARETLFSWDATGNVVSVLDARRNGSHFSYAHDATKNESYCRTVASIGRVEEEWFDARGNVLRQDVNGRTVRLVKRQGSEMPGSDEALWADIGYFSPGRILETDEKGQVVVRDYSPSGYPTKVTYPDGASVVLDFGLWEYQGHYGHRVQQVTDVNGAQTRYTYDANGNMIRRADAAGTPAERVTSFTHDQHGLVTSITAEADVLTPAATSHFTYGPDGNLLTQTDPEGNVTEFLQYDVMGNLLEFKDPRGNRWQLAYDAVGRVLSTSDPLGRVTRREYDGANNLKALVDPLLKRYQFEYDGHDNQIRAIDPLGKASLTVYDLNNLPASSVDRSNKYSFRGYDQEGRLRDIRDGAGNVVQYDYDLTQATKTSSFLPVRIRYPTYTRELTYDVRQRLVRSTDVLGPNHIRSRSYSYDVAGNVATETDEEGHVTRYERDARNRVVRVHDARGGVTEQTYDDRSNVLSVKDAGGSVTRFEYSKNGWLSKAIRPSGRETRYEYDPCGNRTAIIDALGQKAAMHYDAANRLDRTEYFTASDPQTPARVVQFGYDVRDLMTSWSDGAVSGVLTYDDLGRKITETVNYGPFSLTNRYGYYDNGSRRSFTGPDGRSVAYARDANDRLSSLSIPDVGEVGYQQYQWNALTRLALPGGTTFQYGHDSLQRPTSATSRDPAGNSLLARSYQYTPSGDLAATVTERGAQQFQYDRHRLASATSPDLPAEAYTWDPLNNRRTSAQAPGPWTYSADQELLTFPGGHCDYDALGRTVRKVANGVEQVLRYDVTGRLEQIEDGSGFVMARYGYDPFGRRLWKQVAGTVTTYYAYGDEGLIGEYDESGHELCSYGYEPGSAWTTAPLWLRRNGSYYWYHTDQQGRPYKLTDTSGATVWEGLFDSFGTCTVLHAEVEQNLRLPGQYFDLESGLHYNWHRYYDPATGRYLSTDPISGPGSPYAYALANPLRYTDPQGLCVAKSFVGPFKNIFDFLKGGYALATQGVPEGMEWGLDFGFDPTTPSLLPGFIGNTYLSYGLYDRETGALLGENKLWSNDVASAGMSVLGAFGGGGGGGAAGGATRAIGFADDAVASAYQGMRSGGGHAMRHLIDAGLMPNAGSLTSRAQAFERLTSPILRSPAASFDWRVGVTATRAFAGEAGGRTVVVFVAKEGLYQGRVLSAILPDASQIAQWGL